MPAHVERQPEPTAARPWAGWTAFLGLAIILGPFLPGSFLTAGPAAAPDELSGGVVTAAAEELVSPYAAPTTRCTVTDPRLPEISGLAVVGDGLVAMNDGGDAVTVYELDAGCAIVGERNAAVDPYDPEDLAVTADGTVWVADTGDNRLGRETVAMIALRPDDGSEVYRMSYPDGAHDVEALLLAPDGTPYLVTKEVLGTSGIYRPSAALDAAVTVPLQRVGDLTLQLTGSEGGPVGRAGQLMVTGGAVSPDGALVALRTYTDAYVWTLSGSDVAGALAAAPARIALPDSPQGEAIAFGADARSLVVSGEGLPAVVAEAPAIGPLAPAAATGSIDAIADSLTADDAGGLSPWTAGVIAAAAATTLIWASGKVRRRR